LVIFGTADYAPGILREGAIMPALLTGGCAGGAVRYECSGDPIFSGHCYYCRDCQLSTGTAMASVLGMPKAAVKLFKSEGEVRYFEVMARANPFIKI
jgi:hypothetical protein